MHFRAKDIKSFGFIFKHFSKFGYNNSFIPMIRSHFVHSKLALLCPGVTTRQLCIYNQLILWCLPDKSRNFMAHKYFNVVNQAHENFRSSHNTHTHNIGRRHGILRSAGNVRASCSHLFVNYEISNKLWTCTKLLLSLQCQCVWYLFAMLSPILIFFGGRGGRCARGTFATTAGPVLISRMSDEWMNEREKGREKERKKEGEILQAARNENFTLTN